ncbi:MAG: patatin-like phospholipase family protein [Acidiferrobacteraceae bacterium]
MDAIGRGRFGLVLTGGGARTAYQVGVLRAIAAWLPRGAPAPFDILCGTSAGAVNAVSIAAHARDFRQGIGRLTSVWAHLSSADVVRSDSRAMLRGSTRWTLAFFARGLGRANPLSLLDPAPLRDLLSRSLPFSGIDQAIASGVLRAVCVTAMSYATGRSVSFYQGVEGLMPWARANRTGTPAKLGVSHLMASSAIPFLFPAVMLDNEFFGDGSMRQLAPISPALHLGANRLLLIDVRNPPYTGTSVSSSCPSLARIGGHVLNCIFLDGLDADLERLRRINETVQRVPPGNRDRLGLRHVDTLLITPSADLSALAYDHRHSLPPALRAALSRIGALGHEGADLISYLLFEQSYCREVMEVGFSDATARRLEILAFLGHPANQEAETPARGVLNTGRAPYGAEPA